MRLKSGKYLDLVYTAIASMIEERFSRKLKDKGITYSNVFKHFGVYGVCFLDNKLLCIEKNAGPYSGRYDVPGGSQELGESLIETLGREFLEETGFSSEDIGNCQIYDAFVQKERKDFTVHHVFALYDVMLAKEAQRSLPEVVADGKNDSIGTRWVDIDKLNINNSSPIVLKIVERVQGSKELLSASFYQNWIVKEK